LPQLQLDIEGDLQLESAQLAEQLLLCIQEGISNAVRHGQATKLKLSLEQHNESIRLLLDDNGRGCADNIKFGSGLPGMRERMQSFNGIVKLTPLPHQGSRLSILLEQQDA